MSDKSEWTERYGDKHNKRRQKLYQEDAEYRESIKAASRAKWQETRGSSGGRLMEWKGNMVEVHRIGEAAKQCGCTTTIIRNAVKAGAIPEHSFPTTHWVYSQHQIELLKWAVENRKLPVDERRAYLDERWEQF
jgi:hypothetical protein